MVELLIGWVAFLNMEALIILKVGLKIINLQPIRRPIEIQRLSIGFKGKNLILEHRMFKLLGMLLPEKFKELVLLKKELFRGLPLFNNPE